MLTTCRSAASHSHRLDTNWTFKAEGEPMPGVSARRTLKRAGSAQAAGHQQTGMGQDRARTGHWVSPQPGSGHVEWAPSRWQGRIRHLRVIAAADDYDVANGASVMDFWQAQDRIRALKLRARIPRPVAKPITVIEAIEAYEQDLERRGGDIGNASRIRLHLPDSLRARPWLCSPFGTSSRGATL